MANEHEKTLKINVNGATGLKAIAATLVSQARGLSSVLQRPKAISDGQVVKDASSTAKDSGFPERASSNVGRASSSYLGRFSFMDRSSTAKVDDTPILLPWEIMKENGDVEEVAVVKEKILEITVFRNTFVEAASGEDEYLFTFQKYKHIAKQLLYSNPNLREKYSSLVENSPTFIISEENFWKNFFMRCNIICVEEGLPPYLSEVKSMLSSSTAVASLQRFTRDVMLKKKQTTDEFEKLRRNLIKRSISTDSADPTNDVTLGELDLDMDGEIERELMRRRPSRAMEYGRTP